MDVLCGITGNRRIKQVIATPHKVVFHAAKFGIAGNRVHARHPTRLHQTYGTNGIVTIVQYNVARSDFLRPTPPIEHAAVGGPLTREKDSVRGRMTKSSSYLIGPPNARHVFRFIGCRHKRHTP